MSHFNFKDRIGEKFVTKEGYEVEIIEYSGMNNCTIKFNDEYKTVRKSVMYSNLKKGNVCNKNHRSVHNIGYEGVGKYKIKDEGIGHKPYRVWSAMLNRAYSESYAKSFPTYKNTTVCDEWHNFQNFAAWFEKNYVEDWELDKDILCKECKIYSPETCAFVPKEVNYLFTKRQNYRGKYPIGVHLAKNGKFDVKFTRNKIQIFLGRFETPEEAFQAYKIAKEQYIKEVADKWKDKIDPRVYEAMYNYKVLITD